MPKFVPFEPPDSAPIAPAASAMWVIEVKKEDWSMRSVFFNLSVAGSVSFRIWTDKLKVRRLLTHGEVTAITGTDFRLPLDLPFRAQKGQLALEITNNGGAPVTVTDIEILLQEVE